MLPTEPETIQVVLWLVGMGRYRLLAGDHAKHPDLEALRTRIAEHGGPIGATGFDDAAHAVINVRLIDTELAAGKECRVHLPDIVANVLKVREYGGVQVVLNGKFVEIWSVETLGAALAITTPELL